MNALQKNARTALASALLAVAWIAPGCSRADAADHSASKPAPTAGVESPATAAFWFMHAGTQSSASAWFGPVLERDGVQYRMWTLVCALPGSEAPLACLDGKLPFDGADPIEVRTGVYELHLLPADGRTWGEVEDPEHLDTRLEGFH